MAYETHERARRRKSQFEKKYVEVRLKAEIAKDHIAKSDEASSASRTGLLG